MQADLIASTGVQVLELRPLLRRKMEGKELDILFVDGSLWNDTARARGSRGTWMKRNNSRVCWPKVWLPADLGFNVRILSVSYDDVALREKDIPKEEIADAIAHELFEILILGYNQISCHFIIRNLSDCSSNPLAVLLCVCVCVYVCVSLSLSLSLSAEAVLTGGQTGGS